MKFHDNTNKMSKGERRKEEARSTLKKEKVKKKERKRERDKTKQLKNY